MGVSDCANALTNTGTISTATGTTTICTNDYNYYYQQPTQAVAYMYYPQPLPPVAAPKTVPKGFVDDLRSEITEWLKDALI